VRAIAAGDCAQAVVAGVNITLDPFATDCLADAGLMAADGRCKTFDHRADGYVRGEACVAVLVKPLSVARADGDRIYGVVLGSAVNSDGRTNGLTAPNQQAQQVVVRRAYTSAGVSPAEVRYVELHGTGTSVGDPIEARALSAVVAEGRGDDDVVLVGSAKTNVGHTETASGLTGVVKTLLSIRHGVLPPSLHFQRANPMIPLAELKLSVVTEPTPWPEGRRLAGVSSFGWGGTNAHIVLSDVDAVEEPRKRRQVAGRPHVVAVSGRSERSVTAAAGDLLDRVGVDLAGLAHTSTVRRSAHPLRVAAVVRDQAELAARLGSLAGGVVPDGVVVGRVPGGGVGRLGFAFTGQGNQWLAMGRSLIRREPAFRDALLECDRPLRRALGWSPFAVLDRGKDVRQLSDTLYAQPTIFALQVALARLWRSWGVVPDMVVGHSMGEIAAAHVAGIIDLASAAGLIAARAKAMADTRGVGRMAVVQLSEAELAPWLSDRTDVVLAASNSWTWSLLSGMPQPLAELSDKLAADGVAVRKLPGEYAFHGPWMADCLAGFRHAMPELTPVDTATGFYSTVTGGRLDGSTMDSDYWCREAVAPVAFARAVDAMIGDGCLAFVEVGPHPALSPMLAEAFRARDAVGVVVGTLRRDGDDDLRMRTALATVWVNGHPVDWAAAQAGGELVDLPPYPFDRRAYRTEPPVPDAVSWVAAAATVDQRDSDRPSLFSTGAGYVAPRSAEERLVAALWCDLLNVEQVGANDSFQALGGSSLVALQFISRVLADTGVELSITALLDRPTVAGVAAVLADEMGRVDGPKPALGEK
jgi:acyl transferase domain-containing protein